MTKKKKIILGVGVAGLGTMGFFLWKHMKEKEMEDEVGSLPPLQGGHRIPSHMLSMAPIRIDQLDPRLRAISKTVVGRDKFPFAPPPPPPPKS